MPIRAMGSNMAYLRLFPSVAGALINDFKDRLKPIVQQSFEPFTDWSVGPASSILKVLL